MLISADYNGINAGSIFFRRSQWTDLLLSLWVDPLFINAKFATEEQEALRHLMENHKGIREGIGIVPQRMINSYADVPFREDMQWQQGDFVVHFAGCWYGTCVCGMGLLMVGFMINVRNGGWIFGVGGRMLLGWRAVNYEFGGGSVG